MRLTFFNLFHTLNKGGTVKISDALHDLVPFVQFKKREKRPWRSVALSKPTTLLKVTLLHCTNGTKSRKT